MVALPTPPPLLHRLVVEDNPGDVYLIRRALETIGVELELRVIVDGKEALALVDRLEQGSVEEKPDLIVLDLGLLGCHGRRVLQAMRHSRALERVPVATEWQSYRREFAMSRLDAWVEHGSLSDEFQVFIFGNANLSYDSRMNEHRSSQIISFDHSSNTIG